MGSYARKLRNPALSVGSSIKVIRRVGEKEVKAGTVSVRKQGEGD
ncbi:MAG: hypothetical protein ACKVT2_09675 [Saprospiraceae bacterium]